MKTRAILLPLAAVMIFLLSCNLTSRVNTPTPTRPAALAATPTELRLPTLPAPSPLVSTLPPAIPPTAAVTARPTTPPTALQPAVTVTKPPPTQPAPLQVTAKLIKEEAPDKRWIMQIRYPAFSGSPAKAVENLNKQVASWINRQIADFKDLIQTCEPPKGMQVGPNSLYVDYDLTYNRRGMISIYFTPSTYCQGAAHPYPWSETLNYDLANDRLMELAHLFKPGVPYLNYISQRCLAILKTRPEFYGEEGAKPDPDNYKSWNLTLNGLLITFDPYQVAPYAAGYQQVTLPWNSLSEILNPAFQP